VTSPASNRARWCVAILALGVALPLMAALWVAASLWLGPPAVWMAVLVAADGGLLLSLMRLPKGPARVAANLVFLAACCALSAWFLVATHVGLAFGLDPFESSTRLGPVLFQAIASSWLSGLEALWLAAAVGVAVWWNLRA